VSGVTLLSATAGSEGAPSCAATAAGWNPVAPSAGFGCDIDVREASSLSAATFQTDYVEKKRPVLIRGAAAAWPAQQRWTRAYLSAALRNTHVLTPGLVGIFPTPLRPGEMNPAGLEFAMRPSTDEEGGSGLLNLEQPYFFRRFTRNGTLVCADGAVGDAQGESAVEAQGGWRVPMEDLEPRSAYFNDWLSLLPQEEGPEADGGEVATEDGGSQQEALVERQCDTFLSMGGEGSGLKMHVHEAFWAGLVWGRKHWLLCPPGACQDGVEAELGELGLGESAALRKWVEEGGAARHGALQCFQEKGDVLYAPAGTGHAVWNHGECVSVSHVYGPAFGD
jgi:hypothetical protein